MTRLAHNTLQEKYWDKVATKTHFLGREELPYPARKEEKEFFEFMDMTRKLHILEIGCGTGRYTLPLLRKGHYVAATDVSSESLELLKKQALMEGLSKNLRVEKNNFEEEKLCQKYFGKFDLALMVGVIHHFDPQKREKIFKNVVLSVKTGGQVVALEPNPLNPFFYLLYFFNWLGNIQDVHRWTTEKGMLYTSVFNLRRLFQKFGLERIQIKRYALLPSILGGRFTFVLFFNDLLLKIPMIKEFSLFIWIKGKKI